MTLRSPKTFIPVVAVALSATLFIGLAAQAGASKHHAKGPTPCHEWGKKKPKRLTKPQASKAIACYINRARERHGLHELDIAQSCDIAEGNDLVNSSAANYTLAPEVERLTLSGAAAINGVGNAGAGLITGNSADYTGGLSAYAYGENIAWGPHKDGTPKKIVKAWMHSAGHRANILDPRYRDLGIGFRSGSPGKRGAKAGLYTTDFGYRKG